MRGKLRFLIHFYEIIGITPARAGKTEALRPAPFVLQDHPRACGENLRSEKTESRRVGSPPRVRGKLILAFIITPLLGITPARAGKTHCAGQTAVFDEDHPRACGENQDYSYPSGREAGSPPRVRGKRLSAGRALRALRITPARAGKTPQLPALKRLAEDHPRACGENRLLCRARRRVWGSPPRVRGKPIRPTRLRARPRITPARAGQTVHERRRCP